MEYLIDKLKIENHEILKRRPDLKINSDFTEDGEKLHSNELKIGQLNKLPIPLVVGSFYSDGNNYSHLEVNSDQFPEHEECVMCGSTQVTITDDADICHDCGYVYT